MVLRNEHIVELAADGAEKWNAWAQKHLAAKQQLIEAGLWKVETDHRTGLLEGKVDESREWLEQAAVNGDEHRFPVDVSFAECMFPGPVYFRRAQLGNASFKGAKFHEQARFDKAGFGYTSFEAAEFLKTAYFDGCKAEAFSFATAHLRGGGWFQGIVVSGAGFWKTESDGDLFFNGSTFNGPANIEWVDFRANASFVGVTFNGRVKLYTSRFDRVIFDRAKFEDDANFRGVSARDITFERAAFQGAMDFRGLHVSRACSFRSVRSSGDIDLAGADFVNPPDFTLSSFRREPRLDRVSIKSTLLGFYIRPQDGVDATEHKPRWVGFYIDEHAPAKFRELKKIAASTNDSAKELDFHAQELRSSRFVTDWPVLWPGKPISGVARFWFGLAYGALSDFGRSAWLPLLWWLLLIIGASAIYLGESPDVKAKREMLAHEHSYVTSFVLGAFEAWKSGAPCTPGLAEKVRASTSAPTEALQLAATNAVLFADTGGDSARRAFGCLYGLENRDAPNSPPLISPQVAWVGRVQRTLSAMLLFLFGLGLRNMLKMK